MKLRVTNHQRPNKERPNSAVTTEEIDDLDHQKNEEFRRVIRCMNLTQSHAVVITATCDENISIKTMNQHIVLVVDISGSMYDSMNVLTAAVSRLIDDAGDTTVVSLISFSDFAQIRFHRLAMTKEGKEKARKEFSKLAATGATNFESAIDLARTIAQNKSNVQISHSRYHPPVCQMEPVVIFFTDGDPCGQGETDTKKLIAMIKNKPICDTVYVFGMGASINPGFLEEIISGAGIYCYFESASQIYENMSVAFYRIFNKGFDDVTVSITWASGFQPYIPYYEQRDVKIATFPDDRKKMVIRFGDFVRGDTKSVGFLLQRRPMEPPEEGTTCELLDGYQSTDCFVKKDGEWNRRILKIEQMTGVIPESRRLVCFTDFIDFKLDGADLLTMTPKFHILERNEELQEVIYNKTLPHMCKFIYLWMMHATLNLCPPEVSIDHFTLLTNMIINGLEMMSWMKSVEGAPFVIDEHGVKLYEHDIFGESIKNLAEKVRSNTVSQNDLKSAISMALKTGADERFSSLGRNTSQTRWTVREFFTE